MGDSAWEQYAANVFESRDDVAYAKNDHLGFQIHYLWQGSPPLHSRLHRQAGEREDAGAGDQRNGQSSRTRPSAKLWTRWVRAINSASGFGQWSWDVAFDPAQVHDIIASTQLVEAATKFDHLDTAVTYMRC